MAQAWLPEPVTGQWAVFALTGPRYRCLLDDQGGLRLGPDDGGPPSLTLRRSATARDEAWLLLAPRPARVTINGWPLRWNICHLRDRDEVLFLSAPAAPWGPLDAPARFYFSTERLAQIVPLPYTDKPIICVRCKQLIEPGTPAVQCPSPNCRLWHHQTLELPCWTYAEHCAMCAQPTALDAGFRWTPEDL